MRVIIQLCAAFLGAMGFALLFNTKKEKILPASFGGVLEWGIYLLCARYMDGIFVPCLIASAFCALYAEVLARGLKAPATVFFVPSIVPMIPGSGLYYAMSYAVQKDWGMARKQGFLTAQYALGIALGISLVWALIHMLRVISAEIRQRKGSLGNRA